MTYTTSLESPIGPLVLEADDDGLTAVLLPGEQRTVAASAAAGGCVNEARRQLVEYFAGSRQSFDLPLAARGTPFQQRVWQQLRAIPYGETISYAELARRIGSPTAVRAVGAANGRNPIAIIVPCHRVIGSDGTLTGYAGGLDAKRTLLELETQHALF